MSTDIKVGDKFTHVDYAMYGTTEFVAKRVGKYEILDTKNRVFTVSKCKRVEPKVNTSAKIRPGDNFTTRLAKGRTYTCKTNDGSIVRDEVDTGFPIGECTRIGKVDTTPVKAPRKVKLLSWMRSCPYYNVKFDKQEPLSQVFEVTLGLFEGEYDSVSEVGPTKLEALRKCRKLARELGYV